MQFLKQSTAATIPLGPITGWGAQIDAVDVYLSKEGGVFAGKNSATAAAHGGGGIYRCPLDATDTSTVGRLDVMVAEAGTGTDQAQTHISQFQVLEEVVYDGLFTAGATGVVVALTALFSQIKGGGWATANNLKTIYDLVNGDIQADIAKIAGDSGAADILSAIALATPYGTVLGTGTGAYTTTSFDQDLSEAKASVGQYILWATGNLKGEKSQISANDGTTITVSDAFSASPDGGDIFLVTGPPT